MLKLYANGTMHHVNSDKISKHRYADLVKKHAEEDHLYLYDGILWRDYKTAYTDSRQTFYQGVDLVLVLWENEF